MENLPLLTACLSGVIVLTLSFRLFFEDLSALGEAIRFWFTPDFISALNGEYGEDIWNEIKLFLWLACGGGSGFVIYQLW